MSLLVKTLQPRQIFQVLRVLNSAQIKQCHWFPDYKPGPYPKTKEEREAAAKKYNLLPEEYEPYPDDGNGSGDYPSLPFESVDARDPYYDYDYPQIRKDYLDPVHRDLKILVPEILSTGPERYTPFEGVRNFCTFALIMVGLMMLGKSYLLVVPVSEQQYPKPDVKHYTFDLDHGFKFKWKPECV